MSDVKSNMRTHGINEQVVNSLTTNANIQSFSNIRLRYLRFRKYVRSVNIRLTSLTRAKCGTRSTLCWKVGNISGSTELFAL